LGCYDLLAGFEAFRGVPFPETELAWAGTGGIWAGTGARELSGDESHGIPAPLAVKVMSTLLTKLQEAPGGPDRMTPFITNAVRSLDLSSIQAVAVQAEAVRWYKVASRCLDIWHQERIDFEGRSFQRPELDSRKRRTKYWDIKGHFGNVISEVSLFLQYGAKRHSCVQRWPPHTLGPCLGVTHDLPRPSNLFFAETRAEARQLLRDFQESSRGLSVAAVYIRKESSPFELPTCAGISRTLVRRVGPSFETTPACPQTCTANALLGFVGRQLGKEERPMPDLNAIEEVAPLLIDTFCHADFNPLLIVHEIKPVYGEFPIGHIPTTEEWLRGYKGTNGKDLVRSLLEANLGAHSTAAVTAFVKKEFQGYYLPGCEAPEDKIPRIISDRHKSVKGPCIGITAAIGKVLASRFPAYGVYDSPADTISQVQAFSSRHHLPSLSTLSFDISRMDGHLCPALREQLVAFLLSVLHLILDEVGDPVSNQQAELFEKVLEKSGECTYRVGGNPRSAYSAFESTWVFELLGSNCSGDFWTTLFNTTTSLFFHAKVAKVMGLDPTEWFVKVCGDDGLVIGPQGKTAEYSAMFVRVASSLGFIATTESGVLTGDGNRVSYCSRHVYAWYEGPEVVAAFPRLLGKAMLNLNHTLANFNCIHSYVKAKCTSDMMWARGWPVAQALVVGTLEQPNVAKAGYEVDRDTGYKILGYQADGLDLRALKKKARAAASSVALTWKEPSPECRLEFYAHTGVSPDQQLAMEQVLRLRARRGENFLDYEVGDLLLLR